MSDEISGDQALRDRFAMVALDGLMRGAMRFDEHGNERKDVDGQDFCSFFASAVVLGWGADCGTVFDGERQSFADSLASDAYFIADAMMKERSRPSEA